MNKEKLNVQYFRLSCGSENSIYVAVVDIVTSIFCHSFVIIKVLKIAVRSYGKQELMPGEWRVLYILRRLNVVENGSG